MNDIAPQTSDSEMVDQWAAQSDAQMSLTQLHAF